MDCIAGGGHIDGLSGPTHMADDDGAPERRLRVRLLGVRYGLEL